LEKIATRIQKVDSYTHRINFKQQSNRENKMRMSKKAKKTEETAEETPPVTMPVEKEYQKKMNTQKGAC
jgi:hypothetical protein